MTNAQRLAALETRYANMTARCPLREKVAVMAAIRELRAAK